MALLAIGVVADATRASAQSVPSDSQAIAVMKKAAEYYRGKVARHGGYVYYYSPDLGRRLGEGLAEADQIWVQEPGTPTVGTAYLRAFQATGDRFYLDAAVETAEALIHGQLQSGGWTNAIDFNPAGTRSALYRNGKGNRKGRNFSSLDDGITQSSLQFLMQLDQEVRFQNKQVSEAVSVGLSALLAAQFPNGAFPQGWDEELKKVDKDPAKVAGYPPYDWRTEGRIKEYWDMYTINDGVALNVSETLMMAHRIYKDEKYADALKRLGKFLIKAQMPAPQSGWAQQYNYDMQPIWARRFEPAAISGRESEETVVALMKIAFHLKDKRMLGPVPAAIDYLQRSQLPDGKLARYYELKTNKPLYMERNGKEYTLTHDDSKLPSHYGWKNDSRVASLKEAWKSIQEGRGLPDPVIPSSEAKPSVEQIISSLDDQGRWVSTYAGEGLIGQPKFREGEEYINSAVFSRNLTILSESLNR